jgi:hypothetical protein
MEILARIYFLFELSACGTDREKAEGRREMTTTPTAAASARKYGNEDLEIFFGDKRHKVKGFSLQPVPFTEHEQTVVYPNYRGKYDFNHIWIFSVEKPTTFWTVHYSVLGNIVRTQFYPSNAFVLTLERIGGAGEEEGEGGGEK